MDEITKLLENVNHNNLNFMLSLRLNFRSITITLSTAQIIAMSKIEGKNIVVENLESMIKEIK